MTAFGAVCKGGEINMWCYCPVYGYGYSNRYIYPYGFNQPYYYTTARNSCWNRSSSGCSCCNYGDVVYYA